MDEIRGDIITILDMKGNNSHLDDSRRGAPESSEYLVYRAISYSFVLQPRSFVC